MEAASQIFEGKFANVVDDDEDVSMDDVAAESSTGSTSKRKATNIVGLDIYFPIIGVTHGYNIKAPEDSDDDAEDDGDFDGVSHQVFVAPLSRVKAVACRLRLRFRTRDRDPDRWAYRCRRPLRW